jgi:hypothetical protein
VAEREAGGKAMTQEQMVAIFRHTGHYGVFEIDGARWMMTRHFMRRLDFDLEMEAAGDMARMRPQRVKASLGRSIKNKAIPVEFDAWSRASQFGWCLNLKSGTAIAAPYFYLFEDCELFQHRKPIDTPTSSIVAVKDGKIAGVLMPMIFRGNEPAAKPTLDEVLGRIANPHNDWFGIPPEEARRRETIDLQGKLGDLREQIEENDLKIVDIESENDLLRIDAAKIEARLKELKGEKG